MDPRYSRNPADHLGFLIWWCRDAHKNHRFKAWSHDELLAETYLQAHRLLNTTFDPDKATVVTFLKAFLWGAVYYAYWKERGYRFTADGVTPKVPLTNNTDSEYVAVSFDHLQMEFPELTDEEWLVVRLRAEGYTMSQIADVLGLKSPQSVNNRLIKIRAKFTNRDEKNAPRNKAHPPPDRPRTQRPGLP